MTSPAPVVLFVFNRPDHTRRTLTALTANRLAANTELFIYADGPRSNATQSDLAKIEETRSVIKEQRWCGKVTIVERDRNFGLAANIIDGVTSVVNKYGVVVVLEDDIVTAPTFLEFMNDSLAVYANAERVMHIAGYSFPWIDPAKVGSDTFFYRVPSCWGWATWARSWKHYNDDAPQLFVRLCERNLMSYFDFGYSGAFIGQLNANITRSVRTWAVKWYASVALQNGLALHPSVSLVKNIGFDSTGENSGGTDIFDHRELGSLKTVSIMEVRENKYVSKQMSEKYASPPFKRLKTFMANRVKNFMILKYLRRHEDLQ